MNTRDTATQCLTQSQPHTRCSRANVIDIKAIRPVEVAPDRLGARAGGIHAWPVFRFSGTGHAGLRKDACHWIERIRSTSYWRVSLLTQIPVLPHNRDSAIHDSPPTVNSLSACRTANISCEKPRRNRRRNIGNAPLSSIPASVFPALSALLFLGAPPQRTPSNLSANRQADGFFHLCHRCR